MKVLFTSHINNQFKQELFVTAHSNIEQFFCEYNELEYPLAQDKFTVVNEHGVFINDGVECCESWIVLSNSTVVNVSAQLITGEECKALRHAKRMSQEQVARAAGIALMSVQRFESNPEHNTRETTIHKIMSALNS